MINSKYFRDIFGSILDYKKIVLLWFLIKIDKDLLLEIGFSERDINHLNSELKNILIEQHEDYLKYVKNEEESVHEKFLNKQLEQNFAPFLKILGTNEILFCC